MAHELHPIAATITNTPATPPDAIAATVDHSQIT